MLEKILRWSLEAIRIPNRNYLLSSARTCSTVSSADKLSSSSSGQNETTASKLSSVSDEDGAASEKTSLGQNGFLSDGSELSNMDDMPLFNMDNPYEKDKDQCVACRHNIRFDYKNVRLLSQFVSSYTGKPYPRNITGLCKHQDNFLQREIAKSIRCGYMPIMHKVVEYMKDPKLYRPDRPFRKHRF